MVYYADPCAFDAALQARLLPLLPPEKQAAIAKITHAPTRQQSIAVWALLVYALRVQHQPLPRLQFTATGKPFFQNSALHFNLSHTDTLVCAAVSDLPVGIDAQSVTLPSAGVARRVLCEEEQRLLARSDDPAALFTRFWTQKEAYAKLTGEGLSCGFSSLNFAPYDALDTFAAFQNVFHVQQFSGAVMTVCSKTIPEAAQLVTPQMLEPVLFKNDG